MANYNITPDNHKKKREREKKWIFKRSFFGGESEDGTKIGGRKTIQNGCGWKRTKE